MDGRRLLFPDPDSGVRMYPAARITVPVVDTAAVAGVPFRLHSVALPILLGLALFVPFVQAAEPDHVPDEVLVKFRHEASVFGVQQALTGRPDQRPVGASLHRVGLRAGETVEQVILELEALPEVEYAEPNYIRRVQQLSPPNDSSFGNQWGLHNTGQTLPVQQGFGGQPGADIDALAAWAVTTGSRDVVVAIIDTGIDHTHPELSGNLWSGPGGVIGRDFIDGDSEPFDTAGHGTRIAGIIGARGNNNLGIAGISWDVSLMALRAFGTDGRGTVANIVAAIDYAIANNARIINASYGESRFSRVERDALQRAALEGILVVAAACNSGADSDVPSQACYPASYDLPNVISVAATDRADALIPASNYGANTVHLGAPGEHILTTSPLNGRTVNNSLVFVTGTSAAAAFVSGAAALLLAQNPGLDAELLRVALLDNVDPAGNLLGRTVTGGRLNAAAALGSDEALAQSSGIRRPSAGSSGSVGGWEWLYLLAFAALLYGRRPRVRGEGAGAAPN